MTAWAAAHAAFAAGLCVVVFFAACVGLWLLGRHLLNRDGERLDDDPTQGATPAPEQGATQAQAPAATEDTEPPNERPWEFQTGEWPALMGLRADAANIMAAMDDDTTEPKD